MWTGEHTVSAAVNILTDVFSLLLIYSAAGIGWMIFIALPGAVLTVMTQHRVAQFRRTQRDLIEEWGEEVASQIEGPEPETQETSDDQVPA